MTNTPSRASLDRRLGICGQAVTLRRYTGPAAKPLETWVDTPIRAHIRPGSPQEIVSGIFSHPAEIICSPSDVGPAPVVTGRDALMIGVAEMVITIWSPIIIGNRVVRIDGRIG